MMQDIGANEVRRLAERGGQIVDVRSRGEYEGEHLPGALNLPLTELVGHPVEGLDRNRPVIVYCHDAL